MFKVLDPLLEFTYHLLFSWRKFALCIQSLLCMLFLFGWPPCQRSDMILMEVSQHAYDMIHYISGLFGYFSVCEIYINLIWYLYLFMLNKFCLSLSLSLYRTNGLVDIIQLECSASHDHMKNLYTWFFETNEQNWVLIITIIINLLTITEIWLEEENYFLYINSAKMCKEHYINSIFHSVPSLCFHLLIHVP